MNQNQPQNLDSILKSGNMGKFYHHNLGTTMEVEIIDRSKSLKRVGWFVFGTGVLYYCFAYLLRIYPSVIGTQLMQQYSITAQGLGLLTSFYYFAYAPMQLPVGMTVDKIGPRRSLMFACLIGITGTLLFSQTETFGVAL